MQMEIKPYQKAQPIEWNYEELKTQIMTKLTDYKALTYTPEQITAAKKDRANLNSLKIALNNERIRREKEFLEPFNTFKAQILTHKILTRFYINFITITLCTEIMAHHVWGNVFQL